MSNVKNLEISNVKCPESRNVKCHNREMSNVNFFILNVKFLNVKFQYNFCPYYKNAVAAVDVQINHVLLIESFKKILD